jgi:hypothetical protein
MGRQTNFGCPHVKKVIEGSILGQMTCYTLFGLFTIICTMFIYPYYFLLDIIPSTHEASNLEFNL